MKPLELSRRGFIELLGASAAVATGGALTGCSRASGEGEDYPADDIRLVVPYPAGGGIDTTYRTLASLAEKDLDTSIVVTNVTGASGTVGVAEVLNSRADGYTIGAAGSMTVLVQPRVQDLSYDGPDDITPIFQANIAPTVLAMAERTGIRTIDDFLAATAERELTIGIPGGANTIGDVQARQLVDLASIELSTVFADVGQLVPNVLNETFDGAIAQPAVVGQFVEKGDLVIVGAFGDEPIPSLPDVPLFKDNGIPVETTAYEFLFGPADLPENVVSVLHDSFAKALESTEFKEYADSARVTIHPLGPSELAEQLTTDFDEYEDLVTSG